MANFYTGRGAKVYIKPIPDGSSTEPVPFSVATSGITAKGAVAVTITPALPAGAQILRGEYLPFTQADGSVVLVQADETITGDGSTTTSISVYATPASIAAGATLDAPYQLGGRTTASIARSGNRVTSVTFDDDSFESGLTTTISNALTLNGNWAPVDGGFRNVEFFFIGREAAGAEAAIAPLQQFWFVVELPNTDTIKFSKGPVYKGPGSVTSVPLEIPADGIITSNIEAAFNGRPVIVDPVPVA